MLSYDFPYKKKKNLHISGYDAFLRDEYEDVFIELL